MHSIHSSTDHKHIIYNVVSDMHNMYAEKITDDNR